MRGPRASLATMTVSLSHLLCRAVGLACLLSLVVGTGAQAQSGEVPTWLAQELLWASSAKVVAQAGVPAPAVELPAPSLPAAEQTELGRRRARYHRMKVSGYLLAATAMTLSYIAIPFEIMRHDHQRSFGRDSCSPSLFPYVGALAFVTGLTVGAIGSARDNALTRKHGSVAPVRSRWRTALVGLGAGSAMSALVLSMVSICSS